MKKRLLQSLFLILTLCLFLTGCDSQNYRKAINLYNEGQYDAAATVFSELDGYKDSGELQTLSRYWEALTLMSDGEYTEALPRFLKLGSYEDSADRAIECKYQMAIAAFEAEDFNTAESYFLEQPQYRKTPEYLRQITWQHFYDSVSAAGSDDEAGRTLQKEMENTVISITAAEANTLVFSVSTVQNADFRIHDDLTLTLTRESLEAGFTAIGSFGMDFLESEIGSVQTASGKVDISTCSVGTRLMIQEFQMTVTDNLGVTSTSSDPADCSMYDAMSANLSALLTEIPILLTESGIELTLADIGFAPNA